MGHQRISIIENPVFWGQEKVGAGHSFLALHSGAAFIVAYFSPTCSLLHLRLPILVTRHAAQLETLFLANTMPTRMFGAVSSLCSYFFFIFITFNRRIRSSWRNWILFGCHLTCALFDKCNLNSWTWQPLWSHRAEQLPLAWKFRCATACC